MKGCYKSMKLIENGLIPIYEENSKQLVNARELHENLNVGKDFSTWIKDKFEKYGFVEGEDYSPILGDIQGRGKPKIEYALTIDTAKEIAMVENNEQGKSARKYFIEVEKRYKNQPPKQMTQAEILAGVAQLHVELEKKVTTLGEDVSSLKDAFTNTLDVFTAPVADDWKHEINSKVNQIIESQGLNHQRFRGDLYEELENIACCNLASRQCRLISRMKQGGATSKECRAISKLDIIDRDPKLRAIFEGIVRKYQAKYVSKTINNI